MSYEVPRSSSTIKLEFLFQKRSPVNPLHSDISTVQREVKECRFHTCEAATVTPKELYFSPDRSMLIIGVEKKNLTGNHLIVHIVRRRNTKKKNCHDTH